MFQGREKRGRASKIEEGLSPELRKEQFYKNRIEALGISGVKIRKEGLASLEKRRHELRNLFHKCWNSHDAFNAFVGYGLNQRKKFLDKKDNREDKYAVAYLRTLINLFDLLHDEDFNVNISKRGQEIFDTLKRWKTGNYTIGEVIDTCALYTDMCRNLLPENNQACKEHKANKERINEFLLNIRQRYW